MEMERQQRQDTYQRQLQELENEIEHQRRRMKYEAEETEQGKTIREKKEQLHTLKETKARMDEAKAKTSPKKHYQNGESINGSGSEPSTEAKKPFEAGQSNARDEWDFMKKSQGCKNTALDQLMEMIGLETVKDQFLSVKSSVDTKIRQGVSLADERFSCSLLGNPGTGTSRRYLLGKCLPGN